MTAAHINFIHSESGDWEGMYIDGKLFDEGHSLNLKEVLRMLINARLLNATLGGTIEKSDKWFEDNGYSCPENLDA